VGQKTHPYGFRLNVIRTWSSKWYEDRHYARWLHEDLKLRAAIKEKQLKEELQKLTENELFIDIQEVRKAETNAQLVAENIATQLERRVAFRRAMKKAVSIAIKFGAKGIRVEAAGRLAGAEIARDEKYREGRVPLHTLRADIEYGTAVARTTAGSIGIKVWIFKGEVLPQRRRQGMPAGLPR